MEGETRMKQVIAQMFLESKSREPLFVMLKCVFQKMWSVFFSPEAFMFGPCFSFLSLSLCLSLSFLKV